MRALGTLPCVEHSHGHLFRVAFDQSTIALVEERHLQLFAYRRDPRTGRTQLDTKCVARVSLPADAPGKEWLWDAVRQYVWGVILCAQTRIMLYTTSRSVWLTTAWVGVFIRMCMYMCMYMCVCVCMCMYMCVYMCLCNGRH